MSNSRKLKYEVGDVVQVIGEDLPMSLHYGRVRGLKGAVCVEWIETHQLTTRTYKRKYRPDDLRLLHPREAEIVVKQGGVPDA